MDHKKKFTFSTKQKIKKKNKFFNLFPVHLIGQKFTAQVQLFRMVKNKTKKNNKNTYQKPKEKTKKNEPSQYSSIV